MTPLIPDGDFFCAVEQCLLGSTRESALDRIFTRGTCGLEQVVALVKSKTEGDTTELIIIGESLEWRFTLAVKRLTSFSWEDDGTLADAFDNEEVEQIYAAANNANLDQLLSALLVVLEGVEVEVEATWRNQFDKLNAHYLETVDLFTARASGDEWHVFVRELTSGIPALMVGDLEGSLQCKHFQVFGPGSSATLVNPEPGLDVGAHADTRPRLPTPNTFALLDYAAGISSRDRLALALNGLTRALTWYWIANSVEAKKSILTLYFTGSRVVEIGNFRPTSATSVEYDVRLAEWAFSASDP
jgi:hypothetical protein